MCGGRQVARMLLCMQFQLCSHWRRPHNTRQQNGGSGSCLRNKGEPANECCEPHPLARCSCFCCTFYDIYWQTRRTCGFNTLQYCIQRFNHVVTLNVALFAIEMKHFMDCSNHLLCECSWPVLSVHPCTELCAVLVLMLLTC